MIVTTTNTVDGYRITRYLPPVIANIVAGTGFVTDLVAGFSDFSGGRSETYQDQLAEMYEDAIRQLQKKATKVGANCVVGARFDLGEVSGKGMQMFMLSAVATPVVIKTDQEIEEEANAELRANNEREEKEAQRRESFARADSLSDLLKDPAIATEARKLRRIHGRDVGLSYLKQKASELGLGEILLTEGDLPADF